MNENETTTPGESGVLVSATQGGAALQSHGEAADRFENPGLPPHVHRLADDDENAAKRAERQVATMFGLSMLGALVFLVAYFVVPDDATFYFPGIGVASTQNIVLGVALGVSILMIGLGAVHWAKTLMSDTEIVIPPRSCLRRTS